MLSRRTIRGPVTGLFHTPVWTVRPRHATSFGRPTFTESRVAMAPDSQIVATLAGAAHLPSGRRRRPGVLDLDADAVVGRHQDPQDRVDEELAAREDQEHQHE